MWHIGGGLSVFILFQKDFASLRLINITIKLQLNIC